jgi:acetylornithine deacetylase/succinyl-diaminopimelate desuccinylase-like protein
MWSTPDAIRAAVREVMPSVRADLESLVRIPSVSADPARADDVRRSAEATAELFRAEGFDDVRILSAGGGAPAVVARRLGPEGTATRSSRPSEAAGSTAGERLTTRPASPPTWRPSAPTAPISRWG